MLMLGFACCSLGVQLLSKSPIGVETVRSMILLLLDEYSELSLLISFAMQRCLWTNLGFRFLLSRGSTVAGLAL